MQKAKDQFSKLVKMRGKPIEVILSVEEYEHLQRSKPSLFEFMQQSPLKGLNVKISRDKSLSREDDDIWLIFFWIKTGINYVKIN